MKKLKLKKLTFGQKYIFKKDFRVEAPPLSWYAKKGEIVTYGGKSLGYAHIQGSDGRLILMSRKEAFGFLEEAIDTEKKEALG